jgi:hypothetical protein
VAISGTKRGDVMGLKWDFNGLLIGISWDLNDFYGIFHGL